MAASIPDQLERLIQASERQGKRVTSVKVEGKTIVLTYEDAPQIAGAVQPVDLIQWGKR
ncbi:hypothetical protein [Paracoccus sp. PAR01]|uniref:hypothetical protein n=1 Tax=Paracoccus sp. PAR01 TaxID=2769282 RepID=UPI0017812936|nr:hypothetical protein [Paracoccus sp. PAR01]MBD9529024.1 hypothetical protein [Paracoccus sp. PAR01]